MALTADTLDGERLANALRAGIFRVISREEVINKINVFPVPDGDTGTNLALTLRSVLCALEGTPEPHAGRLLVRAADAALDGARGNSGAILAQFMLGLGDRIGQLGSFTPPQFSEALAAGAGYARQAMSEPREGTILTVLSAFASATSARIESGCATFAALFADTVPLAREALAATREQLENLRKANVVDAGAMGFVELIAGMAEYFETGQVAASEELLALVHEERAAAGEEADLTHRYCTECMITGKGLDHRRLREAFGSLGSSLVVAGTLRKARIHLHVNDPQQLFELAAGFGEVSGQKADDMQRQQGAAHHEARRQVAILTDSAADLPDSVLERLDIHVVPVRLSFGNCSYLDKVSLTPEQFFRELQRNPAHPKTSLPPPGDFRRAFEFLGSHYESVAYVGLTARVSGTFQSGEAGALRARTRGRILAIDSQNVSLGQGLIVMRAAEVAAAGGDLAAVEQAVLQARRVTRAWACLATLDYAVRGGRVPGWVRTVARLLGITPLLAVRTDGTVGLGGVLLGRRDLSGKFGRFITRRLPAGRWRVAVAHANAPEAGRAVLDQVTAGRADIEVQPLIPLGTALGVHGGPGCIVIAAQALAD